MPRYSPQRTEKFIRQNGVKVRWERGIKCPCLGKYDRPSLECDLCNGHGYAYPPGTGKILRGILASMSANEQLALAGLVQTGQMNFTPPAGVSLDDGDRVTLLEFPRRDSLIVTRGEEDRDRLYHLEPTLILGVYRIVSTDGTGANALEQVPAIWERFNEDEQATETAPAYWLDGRNLVFDLAATDIPDHGVRYTVEYKYRPKYLVYRQDQPRYRGAQGITMPQGVTLKYMAPSAEAAA